MKRQLAAVVGTSLLLAAGTAWTQDDGGDDDGPLDLTMTLLPENATQPEAVTREIPLPDADQAALNAANGINQANTARQNRRPALDLAEQAINGDGNVGEAMRELARNLRENAGRGEPPEVPGPPDDLPGPGNVPTPPGPPQN